MTTVLISLVIVAAFLLAVVRFHFGSISSAVYYLKHEKGPRRGIVIFLGIFALAMVIGSLTGCSKDMRYLQYAEAYAGVEWPQVTPSPQCVKDGPDDSTTSNGGARLNLFIFRDFLHTNLKYTHHSCAFNEDRNTYDAFGAEFVVPIFDRRK